MPYRTKDILSAILCALTWAVMVILRKAALNHLNVFTVLVCSRVVTIAVVWIALVGTRRQILIRTPGVTRYVILLGCLNFVLNWCANQGMQWTTATTSAVLFKTDVLFTILLGWVLLGEKVRVHHVPMIVLAIVGCLMVIWPDGKQGRTPVPTDTGPPHSEATSALSASSQEAEPERGLPAPRRVDLPTHRPAGQDARGPSRDDSRQGTFWGTRRRLGGNLLCVVFGLVLTINAILIKAKLGPLGKLQLSFWNALIGFLFFAIMWLRSGYIQSDLTKIAEQPRLAAILAGAGAVAAVVFLTYYQAIWNMPVWVVRVLLLLSPAIAALLAKMLWAEETTPVQLIGMALVLGGTASVVVLGRQKPQTNGDQDG